MTKLDVNPALKAPFAKRYENYFGMVVVGLDYGHAGQMALDEITDGSPYGATTSQGHPPLARSWIPRWGDRRGGETVRFLQGEERGASPAPESDK